MCSSSHDMDCHRIHSSMTWSLSMFYEDKPLRFVTHGSISDSIQCPLKTRTTHRESRTWFRGRKRMFTMFFFRETDYSIILMTAAGDFYVQTRVQMTKGNTISWWTVLYLKELSVHKYSIVWQNMLCSPCLLCSVEPLLHSVNVFLPKEMLQIEGTISYGVYLSISCSSVLF